MKKKIILLGIILIIALLTACGTPTEDEHGTTAHEESATPAVRITDRNDEGNTWRIEGDYDSVPTVTLPQRLSEKELQAIKIPTSKDDPYSYVIDGWISWYKDAGPDFDSEMDRYALYDINGDGTDELILGSIDVLGGVDIYDFGVAVEPTYGILIDSIYTISDGKCVEADKLPIRGDAYQTILFDNGLIKVVCCTPRNPWIYYYKMVGDNFEKVGDSIFKHYDGECFFFKDSVENPITEEEFNRRIAEIEGGAHPVELEWKHLQDYGK